MKIKAINRSEEACTRERTSDLRKVHRNLDPALHPHEKAVEYTRALNAAKLQRVFAKPFLGALPHGDGVTALARSPAHLNALVSGTADGVVRLWDVAAQRCLRRLEGALVAACSCPPPVPNQCCQTALHVPHGHGLFTCSRRSLQAAVKVRGSMRQQSRS